MINTQVVQGQWNQIRGLIKQKWGELTDDDLAVGAGDVDQLVGRIQQRTGENRTAIEQFIEELTERGSAGVAQVAERARQLAHEAGSFVQGAGERMRENYHQLSQGARERIEFAEDLVRHNPAPSVALAFGCGLMLGVIVGLAVRSR
jgi:uncharacterized protein YjbJ (UPF0337 family)